MGGGDGSTLLNTDSQTPATDDASLIDPAPPAGGARTRGDRLVGIVLVVACVLLLASVAVRAAQAITNYNTLNFVGGAWVALARDLAEGIFYRPLVSDDGFGGTRFFPLQFVCHAVLIRLGVDPFAAGFALSITWTALLLVGVFVLLRRAGASRYLAAAGALLPLSSASLLVALTEIRGDVLPAALNIWGLAMCLRARDEDADRAIEARPSIAWAAVFFTLAFAAKVTTVFGAAAGFVTLMLQRDRKPTMRLAALTAIGYALVVALIYVASGGRIVEIFRACAAGGTSFGYFVQSPVWLSTQYFANDPFGMTLTLLALGALLGLFAAAWRDLASITLVTTLAITLFIFGSDGIGSNHLIDLNVISVVFVIVQIARGRVAPAGFVLGVHALIAGMAAVLNLDHWRDHAHVSRRAEMTTAVEIAGEGSAPLLSEDPLIPLIDGRRPYVLDSWMLRLIAEKDPAVMQRLAEEFRARKFRAVVLLNEPTRDGGAYLEERVFGHGFVQPLLENYELADDSSRFKVYLPKK
jgi:hypothetical protein